MLRKVVVLRGVVAGVLAVVLAACSMVSSNQVAMAPAIGLAKPRCASSLASYAVPKAIIALDATSTGTSSTLGVKIERKPDRWYCLDFTGSPTAAETITVSMKKDATMIATPFLQAVHSKSIDETARIFEKALDFFFDVAAAVDRDATVAAVTKTGHYELDPFNASEVAQINGALRGFGLCIVIAGYSYDGRNTSDQSYCENPLAVAGSATAYLKERTQTAALPVVNEPGFYFRVRTTYELRIYVLRDKGWRLQEVQPLALENLSPLVHVAVDRAAFTTVQMAFVMQDGTLERFCTVKGSEAAGFVNIPVKLISGLGAMNRRATQAKIDAATGEADLLEKMIELIEVQNAFASYQQAKLMDPNVKKDPLLTGSTTVSDPSTEIRKVRRTTGLTEALPPFTTAEAICNEADVFN